MDRLRIAISEAVDYCIAQAIHNTITMLQSMGCDDTFICAKLCEIYQISETSAMSAMTYLQK